MQLDLLTKPRLWRGVLKEAWSVHLPTHPYERRRPIHLTRVLEQFDFLGVLAPR